MFGRFMRMLAVVGMLSSLALQSSPADDPQQTPPPQHVQVRDDTITIAYGATDDDMAILDSHPDVKVVTLGGAESWDGPAPENFPFKITDIGFAHLAGCKKLEKLHAFSMHPLQVTDGGLKALEGLTQLREMQLGGGQKFTDAGMAHLVPLTNLEELWLDFNKNLGDGTLEAVGHLKKLRVLRFYDAPLTDEGIKHIKDLKNLEDLQLGKSRVGDGAMEVIGTFGKLKTLDLQHTRITDAGLARLKPLKLTWLALNGAAITSAGLTALADMTDLEWLLLEGTAIDDTGLAHLAGMKKLEHLSLSGTHVTDAGIAKLTGLEKLTDLRLNDLPLVTDEVMRSLKELKHLKTVEMNHTQVTAAGFKVLDGLGVKRENVAP
ncbi:MAG TPA: hypothetical protein VGJ15_00960 [Pirellulales bacterium]